MVTLSKIFAGALHIYFFGKNTVPYVNDCSERALPIDTENNAQSVAPPLTCESRVTPEWILSGINSQLTIESVAQFEIAIQTRLGVSL